MCGQCVSLMAVNRPELIGESDIKGTAACVSQQRCDMYRKLFIMRHMLALSCLPVPAVQPPVRPASRGILNPAAAVVGSCSPVKNE